MISLFELQRPHYTVKESALKKNIEILKSA